MGDVFITAVPITKLFAWGEGDSGGHALRETTSRSLCGLVGPSRTRLDEIGMRIIIVCVCVRARVVNAGEREIV